MANSVFTNGTISEIGLELIDALGPTIAPIDAFSVGVDASRNLQGDTIKVPVYSSATAVDYNASTANYSNEDDGGVVFVDVTLNKRKKSTSGVLERNLSRISANSLIKAHMQAVITATFQDICSVITSANFGAASFTGAASTFDLADVADLWTVASTAQFAAANNTLVLNPSYHGALLKDAGVISVDRSGSDSALRQGVIPNLNGFEVICANILPANGQNLVGFITDKSAIAVAFGADMVEVGGSILSYDVVADAKTGMQFAIYEYIEEQTRTRKITVEALYGYSMTRAATLKRMVSA
jgi:hypothetical protein